MKGYYILVERWAVYVKDANFFISQGGLVKEWGRGWHRIEANDIESARAIGEKERQEKYVKKGDAE